jgi:TetR/AcrR family transcriptional regulator
VARRRAADYEAKRSHLLRTAAPLFARHGYDRTSLAMIAVAAGVSKGLVYHYYPDKDAVLADIIRRHLAELIEAVTAVAVEDGRAPERRLADMAAALLAAYRDADAEHQVQVAHLRLLPEPVQRELKDMERVLVSLFADALAAVAPRLARDRRRLKPLTMSLFGMLNWAFLWFREDGAMTRTEYAALAARMVVLGARDATGAELVGSKRAAEVALRRSAPALRPRRSPPRPRGS